MGPALITGTSTGIGFATAVAMARAGYEVVATMRSPDRSPRLQELATREELPISILPLDVDSDDSVARAISEAQARVGPIEVLVNNAGIGQNANIEDAPLEHFRETMETNYFGALRCVKAVLPGMRERRSGAIVNVTSVAGRIAGAGMGAYSASKFALESLTEILAQETRPFNIRVHLVEPGIIATPIFNKARDLDESPYAGERRINALFTAALHAPVPPDIVADRIVEILATDEAPLRHPVGPDAEPFLAWRNSMTDEEWVAFGGLASDEEYAARFEQDFGIDLRPFMGKIPVGMVQE